MKAIIDGKMYNTETAEPIYSFLRRVDKGHPFWLPEGYNYMPQHEVTLYRTDKGAFFEHDTEDSTITVVTEEHAKDIMRRLSPDKYLEFFNVTVEEG